MKAMKKMARQEEGFEGSYTDRHVTSLCDELLRGLHSFADSLFTGTLRMTTMHRGSSAEKGSSIQPMKLKMLL